MILYWFLLVFSALCAFLVEHSIRHERVCCRVAAQLLVESGGDASAALAAARDVMAADPEHDDVLWERVCEILQSLREHPL